MRISKLFQFFDHTSVSKYDSNDQGLNTYLKIYGYHFNKKLSDFAVKMMSSQNWDYDQVEDYVNTLNTSGFLHKMTVGDFAYGANMYYSDFYPKILSESKCLEAVVAIANDEDGYEGQLFSRWLSDIMSKGISIDWHSYC